MVTLSVYISIEDFNYLKSENLSPSELMKKAIVMHKEGEIKQDRFYNQEIERLNYIVKKLQNTITQVGEVK